MNFDYSETQTMIAESARDFAEKYIRPNIMEWDESQKFPVPLFKKMGKILFYYTLMALMDTPWILIFHQLD